MRREGKREKKKSKAHPPRAFYSMDRNETKDTCIFLFNFQMEWFAKFNQILGFTLSLSRSLALLFLFGDESAEE